MHGQLFGMRKSARGMEGRKCQAMFSKHICNVACSFVAEGSMCRPGEAMAECKWNACMREPTGRLVRLVQANMTEEQMDTDAEPRQLVEFTYIPNVSQDTIMPYAKFRQRTVSTPPGNECAEGLAGQFSEPAVWILQGTRGSLRTFPSTAHVSRNSKYHSAVAPCWQS